MKRVVKHLILPLLALFALASCDHDDELAYINVNPTELTFESEGGTQSVTIDASTEWRVEITAGAEWIMLEWQGGEACQGRSIPIYASANTSAEERVGKLLFTSGELSELLTVRQKGAQNAAGDPSLPVATKENTYTVNGKEGKFFSTAFMMVGENPAIVATPSLGKGDAESILASPNYLYAAISPLLSGVEFDVVSESTPYTIISTLLGATIETLAPELTEEVERGKATFKIEGEIAIFTAGIVLADGTELAVNISTKAEEQIVINENTISRGSEKKPIRSAFYFNEAGKTGLYLTPAGLDFAEELDIATWFMYLIVDDALLGGEKISLGSELITAESFMLGLQDNLHEDQSWCITGGDLQGATGTLYLENTGEGLYTALIDITLAGVEYKASFNGECTWFYAEPEKDSNYIIYNGQRQSLTAATLDATDAEVWSLTLTATDGTEAVATLPAGFFDGNARGFSQSAHLTVSYGGELFSKANGYSGTVTALLNEEEQSLTFHFTNYDNCEIDYSGTVTVSR